MHDYMVKNSIHTYDVIIIGAGPGGCACALALQNSGLRVALVDKEIFPRDKICGDAITGNAFKAMDHIHIEYGKLMRRFLDKSDITTTIVFAPNGKRIVRKWNNYSYNSKRVDFDNFLIQLVRNNTTTVILENERLLDVTVSSEFAQCVFVGGLNLTAPIVIGCDGANSVVTRQLGKFNFRGDHVASAVRAYYRDVKGLQRGVNEVHFFDNLMPGYFWIFPLENGWSNVGFGSFSDKTGSRKEAINSRDTLAKIINDFPSIAPRFKNAKLVGGYKGFALPFGTRRRPISGERFMLCGDAATLIDPVGGNGIDNAMWSGAFAAEQAIKCFKKSDFSAICMKEYDQAVYKKIGKQLSRSTLLMKLVQRFPALLTHVSNIVSNTRIIDRMAKFFKV